MVSQIQNKYSSQPQLGKLKSNFAEVIRLKIRNISFYSDLSYDMATRASLWFARYKKNQKQKQKQKNQKQKQKQKTKNNIFLGGNLENWNFV